MSQLTQLCQFHQIILNCGIRDAADECFRRVHADEGTLWLLDESRTFLLPIWNSGPQALNFVGSFRQPLDAGLISVACITEQAICENQVCLNNQQDPTLDRHLGLRTWAMIATPFVFHSALRGIISCVKLGRHNDPARSPTPFTAKDLHEVEALGDLLNRLISKNSPREFSD